MLFHRLKKMSGSQRGRLRWIAPLAAVAATSIGVCDAAAATPTPVAAGGWAMTPVATAASTTGIPPLVPILCRGFLVSVYGNGVVQTLDVDATAACTDQVDALDYSWTWFDATTGQVLWSSGTHTVTNTATLFTSSSSSAGTFGNRNVQLCVTTYKAGYNPSGNCMEVFNS